MGLLGLKVEALPAVATQACTLTRARSHARTVTHAQTAGATMHLEQSRPLQRDFELHHVQPVAARDAPAGPDVGRLAQRAVSCGWRMGGVGSG